MRAAVQLAHLTAQGVHWSNKNPLVVSSQKSSLISSFLQFAIWNTCQRIYTYIWSEARQEKFFWSKSWGLERLSLHLCRAWVSSKLWFDVKRKMAKLKYQYINRIRKGPTVKCLPWIYSTGIQVNCAQTVKTKLTRFTSRVWEIGINLLYLFPEH